MGASRNQPEVLVVGAGIAGVSLAIDLKQSGLNVMLVERDPFVRDRFRGEFLQPYTARGLTRLGLGSIFENPESTSIKKLRFRDLGRDNKSVLSETIVDYPKGSEARVVPCKILNEKLRAHAQRSLGANFYEGAALVPLNSKASEFYEHPKFSLTTADGEQTEVSPKWVVGCDGRQSTVRTWMGGPKAPANQKPIFGAKPEFIMGCEMNYQSPTPEKYEVIRTYRQGTLSYFQLTDQTNRIYWNTPSNRDSGQPKLKDELGDLLLDLNPHMGFEDTTVEKFAGAPADTVWLGPAAKGCFLLAGDALAITTPLGGQGMTCSMKHVETLIELIASSEKPVEEVGASYKQMAETRYFHHCILNFGLYYLFFSPLPVFKRTTSHIMSVWDQNPEMTDRIGRLFGGDDQDTPGLIEIFKLWGLTGHWSVGLQTLRSLASF